MAKYNLWHMAGLDIFLQSLDERELKKYKKEIVSDPYLSPLKSWGLTAEFFTPIKSLPSQQKDRTTLEFMESQFLWKTDLNEILSNPYDALIVTDFSQTIIWTNPGFYKMTGYNGNYALGKKPSFLQGAETSNETKWILKEKLIQEKPFTEKIMNYKKNQKEYWCQIQIFPMQTAMGVSHFLALETELL